MVDTAPRCGRDLEHLLGRLGQVVQPGSQDVAKTRGHPRLRGVASGEEFLDVEGVALGTGNDRLGLAWLRQVTPNRREELNDLALVHRLQLDSHHHREPGQFSEVWAQSVRTPHLIGSVGSDKQHVRRAQIAGQEAQQIQRRPIRPMQILDHQHNPSGLGKPAQQREDGFEEARLFTYPAIGGPIPLVWQEANELGAVQALCLLGSQRSAQLSQHSGERCEGHNRLTQLETGANEDRRSSYSPGEFAHEAGLSDPGLAAEQDDRGARQCRIEDLEEVLELILAAHECRRGNPPRHIGQYSSDRHRSCRERKRLRIRAWWQAPGRVQRWPAGFPRAAAFALLLWGRPIAARDQRRWGSRMREYEVMVIFDPDTEERTVQPTLEKYLKVITKGGGTVDNLDVWGRRRLAYEIRKKSEGIYAVINVTAEPKDVKELDRQFTINESIMRTKVIRPDLH
jgi:small subunit ribosomal protein S6